MKKIWFLLFFTATIQLDAQITTSTVTVEQTNDITLIDGRVGIGTLTPGTYNLAANFTTFNSLLDVDGEILARLGLRVVGPSIGWGQEINFNVFTASLHQNSRNTGSMTGWVAKVHSANDQESMKLSFFDGYTSVYSTANNAVLDQLDATPVLTLESHNNRVGIGIADPQEKLHVNGSIRGNAYGGAIRIKSQSGYVDIGPQNSGYNHFSTNLSKHYFNRKIIVDGSVSSYNQDLVLETSENARMTILNSNGFVGIGMTNPQDVLHVPDGNIRIGTDAGDYGQIHYTGGGMSITNRWLSDAAYINIGAGNNLNALTVMGGGQIGINNPSPSSSYKLDLIGDSGFRGTTYFYGTAYAFEESTGQYLHFRTTGGKGYVGMNSSNDLILQSNNGQVGIGIAPSSAKLHVNGNIKATPTNITWPDFVFKSDYQLPSLEEVEKHINTKGHLENIPSEKEVEEEGVDLVSIDAKLLQKIEELTLYLIEQNKQIEALQEKVRNLEDQ